MSEEMELESLQEEEFIPPTISGAASVGTFVGSGVALELASGLMHGGLYGGIAAGVIAGVVTFLAPGISPYVQGPVNYVKEHIDARYGNIQEVDDFVETEPLEFSGEVQPVVQGPYKRSLPKSDTIAHPSSMLLPDDNYQGEVETEPLPDFNADDWQAERVAPAFKPRRSMDLSTVPERTQKSVPAFQMAAAPKKQEPTPIFPVYPDNQTSRMGRVQGTGQRFDPLFETLLGKGLITSATQGAGKTILNAVLLEQAVKAQCPFIVFDEKGEYASISEIPGFYGVLAGSDEYVATMGQNCYPLSVENAEDFVDYVLSNQLQVIINLPSYGNSWISRAEIIEKVSGALIPWSKSVPFEQRIPCLVFQDEAQLYLPQSLDLLPKEAQKNKDVVDGLSSTFFSLVSNGRSFGFTVFFATQSLTYIAKWAIKNCGCRIFMKHTEYNDLNMLSQIINPKVAAREDIENFPPGTGVVFGFTKTPMVVEFDNRISRHESATPDLSRLKKNRGDNRPTRLKLATPLKSAEQVQAPWAPSTQQEEVTAQQLPVSAPKFFGGSTIRLSEIIEQYRRGEMSAASARIFVEKIAEQMSFLDASTAIDFLSEVARDEKNAPVQQEQESNITPLRKVVGQNTFEEQEEQFIVLGKSPNGRNVQISQEQFKTAVQLRKTGMSKGYRDLIEPFGLSEHHAKELNTRIRQELGLKD